MSIEKVTTNAGEPGDDRKRAAGERRLDGWLGRQSWMEPVGDLVQGAVGGFYGALGRPGRRLKDLAHGVWPLGHPLHPALTDVPLGAWTVAVVADLAALFLRVVPVSTGDVALLVGTIGALVAAGAGYTDFHETYGRERRAGLLHGLVMTLVTLLMTLSLVTRVFAPGARPVAVGVSTVAYLLALFGAYVGGHLTFRFGTMVDRHAFEGPADEWSDAGRSEDFAEGALKVVEASGIPILVIRLNGVLQAIANSCSHAGGPLNEGALEGDVITCPWHGSRFCVSDGSVRGGPATFPQPAYLVREEEGRVRVRPSVVLH